MRWIIEKMALSQKNFIYIFIIGTTISMLGSGIYRIAIGYWMWTETHSTVPVLLITITFGATSVLSSTIFGDKISCINRKKLIVWTNLILCMVTAIFPLMLMLGNKYTFLAYITTGLEGIFSVILTISYRSIVPEFVKREKLSRVNAIVSLTQSVSSIVGPTLGGILVAIVGINTTLLLNAVSYLLALSGFLFLSSANVKQISVHATKWILFPNSKLTWFVGLSSFALNIGFSISSVFFIPYALHSLHVSSQQLGWVDAGGSVGALVAGSIRVFSKSNFWLSKYMFFSLLFGESVCMASLGLPSKWLFYLLLLSCLSLLSTNASITASTLIQRWFATKELNNVFATVESFSRSGQLLGYILTLGSTFLLGDQWIFVLGGFFIFIATILIFIGVPQNTWANYDTESSLVQNIRKEK